MPLLHIAPRQVRTDTVFADKICSAPSGTRNQNPTLGTTGKNQQSSLTILSCLFLDLAFTSYCNLLRVFWSFVKDVLIVFEMV